MAKKSVQKAIRSFLDAVLIYSSTEKTGGIEILRFMLESLRNPDFWVVSHFNSTSRFFLVSDYWLKCCNRSNLSYCRLLMLTQFYRFKNRQFYCIVAINISVFSQNILQWQNGRSHICLVVFEIMFCFRIIFSRRCAIHACRLFFKSPLFRCWLLLEDKKKKPWEIARLKRRSCPQRDKAFK